MRLETHTGYWGIHNDIFYWADTLEDLKLRPNTLYLTPAQAVKLWYDDYCVRLLQEEETVLLFVTSDKRVALNEEYEMLQILLKSVVIGIAPKLVELVSDGISEAIDTVGAFLDAKPEEVKKTEEVLNRKVSDTTKLTQYMYDFIIYTHTDWKNFNKQNPQRKKSMDELVDTINAYMGTSKSRTSLGRIWNGQVNRDDLPAGKAYFDYPRSVKDLV